MVNPPQIELANLGMADSLILMVLALVVFGPRRLPQIGRQIGKLMYEFRKASNDFKFQMEEELRLAEDADRRKKEEEERQKPALAAPPSIEAQADIGAVEPAATQAAAGEPSPYPGEEAYPPQTVPPQTFESGAVESGAVESGAVESGAVESGAVESGAVESAPAEPARAAEPEQVVIPRVGPVIKPPSTGEPIPAARYGAVRETEPAIAADANIGAAPADAPTPHPTETESTTQHG
jgi:sec-independent protein translocase protein TatB